MSRPLFLSFPLLAAQLGLATVAPAALTAQSLPDRTVTIVVGGYGTGGAIASGVFGVDVPLSLIDALAPLAGVATLSSPGGATDPTLATTASFYGDEAPGYYTAADSAELDAVTATYGGGIPRYALIMAKFTRHVLQRTGAEQVNVVGASMGALVTRWMLENDLEGLMSSGRIARWLTYEGVIAGNWAASQEPIPSFVASLPALAVDLHHMSYGWTASHVHSPRHQLDEPLFRHVQIGQSVSTRDASGALTAALWLDLGAYRPNDGVVLVEDGYFHSVTEASRYLGRMPTLSYASVDHAGAVEHEGLWAHVATQLQGSRRVQLTLERVRFDDLAETVLPFVPNEAEMVFESSVVSPWIVSTWGITDPVSSRTRAGATAPLIEFGAANSWQTVDHVVFDDLVMDGEQTLELELAVSELDIDDGYGLFELLSDPGGATPRGTGVFALPLDGDPSATWRIAAGHWEADVRVDFVTMPVGLTLHLPQADHPRSHAVSLAGEAVPLQLAAGPNQAGLTYLVLGSVSGTSPGLALPAGQLPLNWDVYTDLVLATLNAPEHQAFYGTLDAMGRSEASFNAASLPLPASALGGTLSYAAVVFDDLGGVTSVTNAVSVSIGP